MQKNKMDKIFITGCARSGTSLLHRCFYAFDVIHIYYNTKIGEMPSTIGNRNICSNEIFLYDFVKYNKCTHVPIIAKRNSFSIFSTTLSLMNKNYKKNIKKININKQINLIKKNNIKIINIIRDGRDVILSKRGDDLIYYTHPKRWVDSMYQRRKYKDIITYELRYEDLINDPNKIQTELELKFNLNKVANFSDYPDFIPHFYIWKKHHKKIKIHNNSMNKDLSLYKKIYNSKDLLNFKKELKLANYL